MLLNAEQILSKLPTPYTGLSGPGFYVTRAIIPTHITDCLHIPWANCYQINNFTLHLQLILNHICYFLQDMYLGSPTNESHSITCRIKNTSARRKCKKLFRKPVFPS